MTNEPILTKRKPHPWDYQIMTWDKFIELREWAKNLANETGFPVYLVGSVLTKDTPRDFDVSVIMPHEEYERRYGVFPSESKEQEEYMTKVHQVNIRHYFEGRKTLGERVSFDLKFCPDTWFKEKDKLLLAKPNSHINLNLTADRLIVLYNVIQKAWQYPDTLNLEHEDWKVMNEVCGQILNLNPIPQGVDEYGCTD